MTSEPDAPNQSMSSFTLSNIVATSSHVICARIQPSRHRFASRMASEHQFFFTRPTIVANGLLVCNQRDYVWPQGCRDDAVEMDDSVEIDDASVVDGDELVCFVD